MWVGQFLLCVPVFYAEAIADLSVPVEPGPVKTYGAFRGAGFLCVFSPIFIYVLLNYVSGVPILEASSDERWGHEPAYQLYKKVCRPDCSVP